MSVIVVQNKHTLNFHSSLFTSAGTYLSTFEESLGGVLGSINVCRYFYRASDQLSDI